MHKLEFYIRLITTAENTSLAKQFYKVAKNTLLSGLMISIEVPREHYGLDNALMKYNRISDEMHTYEIPLSRHLEYQEYITLLKNLFKVDNNINVEISSNWRSKPESALGSPRDISMEINWTLAKLLHNKWVSKMTSDGWRYGVDVDYANKVSPLLLDWNNLPAKYQTYDITLDDITKILGDYGYKIVKNEAKASY